MRILYVEDDSSAQIVAKNIFLKSNHELLMCKSVADAEKIITHYSFKLDAIILDLNLEDSNGIELLKILKENSSDIPVIIVSGYCNDYHEPLQQLYRSEKRIYATIEKPFSIDSLLDTLNEIANSSTR